VIRKIVYGTFVMLFIGLAATLVFADKETPTANVVVAPVRTGTIIPTDRFIATVYYPEISDVSAEISGSVTGIDCEEGQRYQKGDRLITLDTDLIETSLRAKKALHEQVLYDLEKEQRELIRTEALYTKKIISEKQFDDQRFLVRGLEKKAAALNAEVDRLTIEREKTVIRAPFDGIVIARNVARGEWLSPGHAAVTMARNETVDVITNVPQSVLPFVHTGLTVPVTAGEKNCSGRIHAVIPQGDIKTRTFPVKIRVNDAEGLLEGMEAFVELPTGQEHRAFLVPRDALIRTKDDTIVFLVKENEARSVSVSVIGYKKDAAGIAGDAMSNGDRVIVTGQENLRDGQPVSVIEE